MRRQDVADDARAAAVRHVHVDEHDVRDALADQLDRGRRPRTPRRRRRRSRRARSAHPRGTARGRRRGTRVAASPSGIVAAPCAGSESSSSQPFAGRGVDRRVATVACEPADDRRRDPAPVLAHRRRVEAAASITDEHDRVVVAHLEIDRHGRRAGVPRRVRACLPAPRATAARGRPSGQSRTRTTSIGTPYSASTTRGRVLERGPERPVPFSVAGAGSAAPGARLLSSQSRSSRSCSRARRTTSRGSSARRCTSASVCRTESWRCAAMSARSSARMRSRRSCTSAVVEPHQPGSDHEQQPGDTTSRGRDAGAQRRPRARRSRAARRSRPPSTPRRPRRAPTHPGGYRRARRPPARRPGGRWSSTGHGNGSTGSSSRDRAHPQQRDAERGRRERPHDRVAEPEADRAREQQARRARRSRARPPARRRARGAAQVPGTRARP